MIEKIKNFFIQVATLGTLGNWFFGGVVSAILAIPFLYLIQLFHNAFPAVFHSIWIVAVLLCLISIYMAIKEHKSHIVLHKFIGIMVAFYTVPLTLKIVFSGILLFYLWDALISFLLFKNHIMFFKKQDGTESEHSEPGKIKQVFYLLFPSIISGIIVNLFLHMALWIVS
jgi:hypothetical protein